ncbi:MAG: hypothetical protein WKF35_01530 [Ferruginibacter sp.]
MIRLPGFSKDPIGKEIKVTTIPKIPTNPCISLNRLIDLTFEVKILNKINETTIVGIDKYAADPLSKSA